VTFDELEAFVRIADVGGFTEAAKRLHRSQPAISRRIHELEHRLGTALFERVGRRVTLTDAGRALLPYAEAALAAIRDGERAVRDQAANKPAFRLVIVGTLADSHIVDALREFPAEVDLRTATSREVSALVRSGEADLGLRYHPDLDPKLESITLGEEKLYVVVPANHRVTAAELPDLSALRTEKWLGFPAERGRTGSFRGLLEHQLTAAGLTDPVITTVDSLTAQKRLIEAGLGVALMPVANIREELRIGSLRVIDVDGLDARIPVVAVRRAGGYQSRAVTDFLALLSRRSPGPG
jgi:DNA-binding transcriptional LysR family regulator